MWEPECLALTKNNKGILCITMTYTEIGCLESVLEILDFSLMTLETCKKYYLVFRSSSSDISSGYLAVSSVKLRHFFSRAAPYCKQKKILPSNQ